MVMTGTMTTAMATVAMVAVVMVGMMGTASVTAVMVGVKATAMDGVTVPQCDNGNGNGRCDGMTVEMVGARAMAMVSATAMQWQ